MVAQQRKFSPAYSTLKKWLDRVGQPRYADYRFCLNDIAPSWYWQKARGGGCWYGLGWHACWVFTFLFGGGSKIEMTPLSGKDVGWTYDTDDTCIVTGKFGVSCQVRALLSVSAAEKKEELVVEGSNGSVAMSRKSICLFDAHGRVVEREEFGDSNNLCYVQQLRNMIDTVQSGCHGIDRESSLTFEAHSQGLLSLRESEDMSTSASVIPVPINQFSTQGGLL